MKLYYHPASPNARSVLVASELAQVPLQLFEVDVVAGQHHSDEYLALNPNGLFPTLIDGDFVLWETVAILQYVAAMGTSEELFPDEPARRADICRWQCWNFGTLDPGAATLYLRKYFQALERRR